MELRDRQLIAFLLLLLIIVGTFASFEHQDNWILNKRHSTDSIHIDSLNHELKVLKSDTMVYFLSDKIIRAQFSKWMSATHPNYHPKRINEN